MSEKKIFAGPRIRRLRTSHGLTQRAMAQELGVSPSYLNLIERNQRPLTVQLLLKLESVYKITAAELHDDGGAFLGALKEVFADPLLEGELPGPEELVEIAATAPNVSNGIVKLHRAYRESQDRLSDLNAMLAQEGLRPEVHAALLPTDELRRAIEDRANYYDPIDRAAENFVSSLERNDSLRHWLKNWLFETHRITVQTLPVEVMPQWRRRFDKHSMRLFISDRLTPQEQTYEIAMETALLALAEHLEGFQSRLGLRSDEAKRLARFEFSRYAALAMMMPYGRFLQTAKRMAFDIEALAPRFRASYEQTVNRLSSLGRAEALGPEFFFLEVDLAGNIVRRAGVKGYPHTKFGGECPKLGVYEALARPNQMILGAVETPEGETYATISRSVETHSGRFGETSRKTAIMLCCGAETARETVYAPALARPSEPVGPVCRLCERTACFARAAAPVTRPLALDEAGVGLSAFDFS